MVRGVEYSRVGTRVLRFDIVRPAVLKTKKLPVVLYFHGGGWRIGDYRKIPSVGFEMARAGFAFASLEFRGSDEAIFPAPLEDARAAVRFFKTRGRNFSVDGAKIGAYGVSTGGQIAALLAFSGSSVSALVTQSAPTNLATMNVGSRLDWSAEDSLLTAYLGGSLAEKRAIAERASPLFFADETAPPTLLLHGQDDDFIAPAHSEKLFQKLKKAGARVSFVLFENEGHSFKDSREKANAEVLSFFRAHLK